MDASTSSYSNVLAIRLRQRSSTRRSAAGRLWLILLFLLYYFSINKETTQAIGCGFGGVVGASFVSSSSSVSSILASILLAHNQQNYVSTIAATLGSTIPFVCGALGLDPSVIAGPAMTIFVDVSGLMSYFLIANQVFRLYGIEL